MRADAATLRLAVFPRPTLLTDAILVVSGTALVSICAQISVKLPFTPVPITGQTFAVCLVGASLGAVRGAASLTLYFLVPGDLFKLYCAAALLPAAWRGVKYLSR